MKEAPKTDNRKKRNLSETQLENIAPQRTPREHDLLGDFTWHVRSFQALAPGKHDCTSLSLSPSVFLQHHQMIAYG